MVQAEKSLAGEGTTPFTVPGIKVRARFPKFGEELFVERGLQVANTF